MIRIAPNISIDEKEITLDFIRASGPGGQNVNKVSTAVRLSFDVKSSASLPDDVRERLMELAGKKVTEDGILIIKAERFRTQVRNRKDAMDRLVEMIREALVKPKARKKTKQSAASKKRVLDEKRYKSKIKKLRKPVQNDEL